MHVLAVDQGTSATKAIVVADDGTPVAEATAPVHPQAGPAGAVEQDPLELLASIERAGREAIAAAGVPVEAVALGNQGETVLRWDPRTGEPLGPAISWQDRRAVAVTDGLADAEAELVALTGLPLDPYFAAPKQAWLRRRDGNGGVITTIDAWVNHRLAGVAVTDAATASRTMLLDLEAGTWSARACELFGLDADALPPVVACDEPIGTTTAFGPPLPVTGLAVDQQAALLAERCTEPGEAKCTYGTGAFILANAGTARPRSASRLAACVAWRAAGETVYCLDGQSYTAGAAVSWLRSIGLLGAAAELDGRCGAASPAGERPVFVPALAGLGAPHWAPGAQGAWLDLTLATSGDDLVAAVAWGIAAQIALLGRAMAVDVGVPLRALRVDGGLSRSDWLLQAQADLLQVPVDRYPSADATALGLAALARLGAGAVTSVAAAVPAWQPAATFEPRIGPDEAAAQLARFDAAAQLVAERGRG